jgi:hypothetical protein
MVWSSSRRSGDFDFDFEALPTRRGVGCSSRKKAGGVYLTSREFIAASCERHPLALDGTVYQVLTTALAAHEAVIVDDFHWISLVSCATVSRRS